MDSTNQTIDDALQQIEDKLNDIPVLCGVVLDKSGSMQGLADQTISGFNEFLQEQKKQPGKLLLYLTMFDSTVVPPKGEDVQNVSELDSTSYRPDGMTALYDAIGVTIAELDKAKAARGAQKVALCIITDGHENQSQEYTSDQIRKLIESRQNDGWDVLFLGAGMDVIQQAANMGIAAGSTASYAATYAGTQAVHSTMSSYVTRTRTADSNTANFIAPDELAALQDDGDA